MQAGGVALSASIASDQPAHLAVLALLLGKGANVHAADNFALRWACSHGRCAHGGLSVSYLRLLRLPGVGRICLNHKARGLDCILRDPLAAGQGI